MSTHTKKTTAEVTRTGGTVRIKFRKSNGTIGTYQLAVDLAVADAAKGLLDVATTTHYHDSGESLTECHMCGEWEDHATGCPVPVLQQWMKGSKS